jgi:hypothetical protein
MGRLISPAKSVPSTTASTATSATRPSDWSRMRSAL